MIQYSKWKTIGYAAAIFVAGGVSGGALGVYETKSHLFAPPPEQEMALRIRNRLQAKLGLSEEQMAKIKPIVEGAARDLHSIRAETAQRINKVFDDSYAQVSCEAGPDAAGEAGDDAEPLAGWPLAPRRSETRWSGGSE